MLIDPATFRRLVRARDLLAAIDGDQSPTVRAIATTVGLSPFHFIRVFAAVFGDTPHQFRTRLRVERARALLASGETVTGACFDVGFHSVGSFSALFTRWVGAPPSSYRRSVAVPDAIARAPIIPGCLGLIAALPHGAWSNSREAPRA